MTPNTIKIPELMQGKKTYTGLAIALIGTLNQNGGWGLDQATVEIMATKLVDNFDVILQLGGLVLATYGRSVAKPKPIEEDGGLI